MLEVYVLDDKIEFLDKFLSEFGGSVWIRM